MQRDERSISRSKARFFFFFFFLLTMQDELRPLINLINENFHPFYRALDCTNDNRVCGEHIAKIKFIQFIVGIGVMDEGT